MTMDKKILVFLFVFVFSFAFPALADDGVGKLNLVSLTLDILLLLGVFFAFRIGSVFSGDVNKAYNIVFIGFFIIATDHLIETVLFYLGVGVEYNEILHRLLHLVGVVILIFGFYKMRKIILRS